MSSRQEIFDRLMANPLFKQYYQHTHHSTGPRNSPRNTEPWHAFGERLNAAALCALGAGDERVAIYGVNNLNQEFREKVLVEVAESILEAAPFLWSDHTEDLADAAPLPKHVVSPTLLCAPHMFWARESAYQLKHPYPGGVPGTFQTNWIFVWNDAKGVTSVSDVVRVDQDDASMIEEREENFALEFAQIPYGWRWPNDFVKLFSEKWENTSVAKILKRCAFLSSPYVNKDKVRLARHHRRQLERAGEPPEKVEEQVHVVKLRREVKEPAKKTGADGSSSIEWQHQWWVSGHYRAQWYPHEEAHRVIWIAPYMKGPSDKPVLEKVYAVVR
jgi:hypothetical protein